MADMTDTKKRKVAFIFEAPDAREVCLVGSFNDWSPKKHPMKKNGDGLWCKSVMLPAGDYEYKFVIDGRWIEDLNNERRCVNCFGTVNSIVCVRK